MLFYTPQKELDANSKEINGKNVLKCLINYAESMRLASNCSYTIQYCPLVRPRAAMPGRSCQEKTFRGSGSVNRHIQIMNEAKASYAQRLALRRVSSVVGLARREAHDVRPTELDGL